ncbi:hypothetical protein EG329_012945 [Mollisiaceae sp. DMI_Dod_QoI]|nr:hypothetical protein EG329_012945 [Helotiales sp. DMI_Dod_QoI]
MEKNSKINGKEKGKGKGEKEEGLSAAEKGRQRYAQKDYEGALEAFSEKRHSFVASDSQRAVSLDLVGTGCGHLIHTSDAQAIELSTQHLLLNALDNRAATFEKLDRLRAALRDAKRMIEVMPAFSKGYLRCGKVLQLSGHDELALQIYERGLKKVKINADKGRQLLQGQYNKLLRAMNPGRSLDPLQYLPFELGVMICKHLELRDRVVCLAVSRGWKTLMESRPDLWDTLDTSYCRKPMSLQSLKIHLRRGKYKLRYALITIKARYDTPKMGFLTRTCEELQELRIEGLGLVGESLSAAVPASKKLESIYVSDKTEVSLATLQSCLGNCKNILDMTFLRVKGSPTGFRDSAWKQNDHILKLELRSDKRSQLDIVGLRNATPNLTTAILPEWKIVVPRFDLDAWTVLEHLDLTNTQITRFPKLPPTLKHLILADNPLLAVRDQAELLTLTTLPLLETFNCHCTALDAVTVKHITLEAIVNRHLKKLFIGGRMNDTQQTPVEQEFPASETVEELSLALLHLNDSHALQIVGLYPNLRKVDMSGTQITGVAVKELVNRGITSLKLNECHSISPDAVQWARSKGIDVLFNFPSRLAELQRFSNSAIARAV